MNDTTVRRIEVFVMPKAFLNVITSNPALTTAPHAMWKGARVEGAKVVLTTISPEEAWDVIIKLIREMEDPDNQHVRITNREGNCTECAGTGKPCPHIGRTSLCNYSVQDIDPRSFLFGLTAAEQ